MKIKEMLIEIYNTHDYKIYNVGFTNNDKNVYYQNFKIISFIKHITRKLRYGPKQPEDYIKDGYMQVVFNTEYLLNDAVNDIEKVKSIDEAIDNLLSISSGWALFWIQDDIFNYTITQLYNKKPLDPKKWGW